jgi:plasmid stabilization system protein ParE
MKLELSRAAEAELFAARDFYEGEREGLGQDFVDEMEAVMARIVANPLQLTQLRRSKSRRALGRRFPYKIVFTLLGDRIRILAAAHQHRRPHYWKARS